METLSGNIHMLREANKLVNKAMESLNEHRNLLFLLEEVFFMSVEVPEVRNINIPNTSIGKNAIILTTSVVQVTSQAVLKTSSNAAAKAVAGVIGRGLAKATVVVQLGLQIKEIVDLSRSWESTHPSAKCISEILSKVEVECCRYEKLQNEVEKMFRVGKYQEIRKCLSNLIYSCKELMKKLRDKQREVDKHHNDCNITKTVGTSVNSAAVVSTIAGVVLAPFTAGLSLGLVIGGLAGAGVGMTMNAVTDVVDINITQRFAKEVATLCKTVEDAIEKMANQINMSKHLFEIEQQKFKALEVFHNVHQQAIHLFDQSDVNECTKLVKQTFLFLNLQEDTVQIVTNFLFSLAIIAVMDEDYSDSLPENIKKFESWFQQTRSETAYQTKVKTKQRIMNVFKELMDSAMVNKTAKKETIRGDPIINNAVISIHKKILEGFMNTWNIPTRVIDTRMMTVKNDRDNPLVNEDAEIFIEKEIVEFSDGRPPNINAYVFEAALYILNKMCIRCMSQMYDSYTGGTTRFASIRYLCQLISSVLVVGDDPIFVDATALRKWLDKNRVRRHQYESAKYCVQEMFSRLHNKIKEWVHGFIGLQL